MSTNPEDQSLANGTSPVGAVTMFAGSFNPENIVRLAKLGWLPCDGARLKVTDYRDLFDVIGNSHGRIDDTFFLPDLRGKFVRGVDGGARQDPDAKDRYPSNQGGNKGDQVGSLQRDVFRKHSHNVPNLPAESHWAIDTIHVHDVAKWATGSRSTGDEGGSETRPFNLSLNFIIRYR